MIFRPSHVHNEISYCGKTKRFIQALIKKSKLRVTGLCEGNSPVTGEFPAQRASNTENASISWRHHGYLIQHIRSSSCGFTSYKLNTNQPNKQTKQREGISTQLPPYTTEVCVSCYKINSQQAVSPHIWCNWQYVCFWRYNSLITRVKSNAIGQG